MDIIEPIYSSVWKILPSSMFNPCEGDKTLEGLTLYKRPSLSEDKKIKFAVFTDPRFYISHLYEKLIPFLPEGFEVVGEPNGQNCFMYCLDIDAKTKNFGAREFDSELYKRGYEWKKFSKSLMQEGNIIVYSVPGVINSIRKHAGIYIGDGRVQSRWGENSPLIEHPLKEVSPRYWNKDENFLTIERKLN